MFITQAGLSLLIEVLHTAVIIGGQLCDYKQLNTKRPRGEDMPFCLLKEELHTIFNADIKWLQELDLTLWKLFLLIPFLS